MNMEINYFLITFIILIIILTIYFPISGYNSIKKLKKNIASGDNNKRIKFYHETILLLWIPFFLILLLIPISGISLNDIGIKWIHIDTSSLTKWAVYPAIGFYVLFLFYNIYSIIIFKSNKDSRAKAAKGIPDDLKFLFPITQKEKRVWSLVSISAGITEEIMYRGYLFYALAIVFPILSLIQILFITTLIFGIGHIYQGKEVIKSTILGLIFGIFYIVFDSVIPIIIAHIAQDLVVRDIFEEEIEKSSNATTNIV
jgi:membrane protease YdiL (CAAX protease family)